MTPRCIVIPARAGIQHFSLEIIPPIPYTIHMTEYYTEAFVLDKSDFREHDGMVRLYTEELGKISARARGLKKILSKSSAHLEPFNVVRIRLMHMKSGYFQIIDVLPHHEVSVRNKKKSARHCGVLLAMAEFIDRMTRELHPDQYLWHMIKRLAEVEVDKATMHRFLLKAFGFDPQYATCNACACASVAHFLHDDHGFYCAECASKTGANAVSLV